MSICIDRRTNFGRGVKNELIYFSENTTSHGIPRIGRAKNLRCRVFWTLIFICCLCAFVYLSMSLVMKYFRYETITQITLEFKNSPFPAVTFCNLSPYKKSEAEKVPVMRTLLDSFSVATSSKRKSVSVKSISPSRRRAAVGQLWRFIRQATSTSASRERDLSDKLRHVPVYAHCDCGNDTAQSTSGGLLTPCRPLFNLPNEVDAQCVCIYDTVQQQPWLCHDIMLWSLRRCEPCELTGRGVCPKKSRPSKEKGEPTIPCLCINSTKSCLAVREPPYAKLWLIGPKNSTPKVEKKLIAPKMEMVKEFPIIEATAKDVGTITSQVQDSMIFATAGLPPDVVERMGFQAHEFIRLCSFNQKDCSISDFKLHIDPKYGNCYTFNSEANASRASIRAGPMYGLSVVLYVNSSEYLPIVTGKGVRIAVHPADDYPFPDMFGYNAPTGFLSSFGLRLKRIERLEKPYGDCAKEGKADDYIYPEFNYSTEGCFRTCLQRILAENCNCSDPLFPPYKNYSHCRISDHAARSCINRTKTELGGLHGDFTEKHCASCVQPCTQSVFDVAFSTAKWPHPVSISNYYSLCEGNEDRCEALLTENAVALEIYYEQLNYLYLKESSGYPGANLLADLGGQLGLWLGFSVITTFEIICLLVNICRLYFKVRVERKNVQHLLAVDSNSQIENGDANFNDSTVTMTLNMNRVHLPDALTKAKISRQENTGRRFALQRVTGRRWTLAGVPQVFDVTHIKLVPRGPATGSLHSQIDEEGKSSRSSSTASALGSSLDNDSRPPLRKDAFPIIEPV